MAIYIYLRNHSNLFTFFQVVVNTQTNISTCCVETSNIEFIELVNNQIREFHTLLPIQNRNICTRIISWIIWIYRIIATESLVNTNGNVACSAETSIARKVLDIVAVLAYLSFNSFRFNRNNNAITSAENQSLSHTESNRARRSHLCRESYIEIVVIVDSNSSRLFAVDWLAYVNVEPLILVCLELEATRPVELSSLVASA